MTSRILAAILALLAGTNTFARDRKPRADFNPCELELASVTERIIAQNSAAIDQLSQTAKRGGYLTFAQNAIETENKFKEDLSSLNYSLRSAGQNLDSSAVRLKDNGTKAALEEVNQSAQKVFDLKAAIALLQEKQIESGDLMFRNLKKQFPDAYPLQVYEHSGILGVQFWDKDTYTVNNVPVIAGLISSADAKASLAGLKLKDEYEECDLSQGKIYFVIDPRYSLDKISLFLAPARVKGCNYGPENLAWMVKEALQHSSAIPGCAKDHAVDGSVTAELSQTVIR